MILSIVLSTFILVNTAFSEVEPPNYDFSLDNLSVFMPGSNQKAIEAKFTKGEELEAGKLFKYYVAHVRYKFPVFVEYQGGVVQQFHARLPTYFLHDVFHQSLINRYGKQNQYFKSEEQALYVWNNIKGNKLVYSGACTITCFPIYMTVMNPQAAQGDSFLKKFQNYLSK